MDRFVYLIYRTACWLISLLPIGLVFRGGATVGWLTYWFAVPYRKLAVNNLRIAFGNEKSERELRRLAHSHFSRLGANLLSGLKIGSMASEDILQHVAVEGMDILQSEVARGKGIVFLVSHTGNWEVLSQICPLIFGCKAGTIYQRLSNPFIDADVRAARNRLGLTTFERKEGFQGAMTQLREGGAVGVLVDQHAGDAGTWCPLFGRLASTSSLAATLALRTGSGLLAMAVYTDTRKLWRVVIEQVDAKPTRDIGKLTAEINIALERQIMRVPPDWFWVHNRWKTPKPNFLLSEYKRGIAYPVGFDLATLKPFEIVIRSSNWLGDAVMTTPAVQAIKRGRPDARVTILTKAKLADYWKRVPEVDAIITIDAKDSVFAVAKKLRGKFDVAVLFPNSIRSGLEVWLAGVPRRVGYPAKWRDKLLNQVRVPEKKKKGDVPLPAQHQVYRYLDLAKWLGADIGNPKITDFFQTPRPSIPANGRIKIGLCPGAEYGPAKRWSAERFAQVALLVTQRCDCEFVLFGVQADEAFGKLIAPKIEGKCTNLIGKTTLSELMDGLSECRLLLTNDTGTMHLAAFLGVPTVAIFGSTEPRLTGPLGSGHHIIRHQVECSPCFLRECPIDFRCMKSITAEEPVEIIMRMLAEQNAPASL